MSSAKKMLKREEICSACLEHDSKLYKISDDYIKEVYKCFTGDYDSEVDLYLCNYCEHTIIKASKFISMCVQSYSFLTKNVQSSEFDSCEVAEEKALLQNCINCSQSKTFCIPIPFRIQPEDSADRIFTVTNNEDISEKSQFFDPIVKMENISEDSNDRFVTCFENVEIEFPAQFKQETIQSTSEYPGIAKSQTLIQHEIAIKQEKLDYEDYLSDCADNKALSTKSDNDSSANEKPKKIKPLTLRTMNLNKNLIKTKLSREEQIKELEEKRQSERYLKAVYKCEKCAIVFHYEKPFKTHMMKHDESPGSFECWLCHLWFSKIEYLKAHCNNHATILKCKLCNFTCHSRIHIRHHLDNHAGVTYPCKICHKEFKTRKTLAHHLECHEPVKKYKCQQCDKSFSLKNTLILHEYVHTDVRPYICETCGKACRTNYILKKHMQTHSEKIITGEHYCVECDKYFDSELSLKRHFKHTTIHTEVSLMFECKQCPKKCKSQTVLNHHIKQVHDKVLTYPCKICGKVFTNAGFRSKHKRKVHDGYVKPLKYGCPTCDKCFKSKQMLNNHIRTHTGERPFKCHLCDWKFTQKVSLDTHIKLKHSNYKMNTPKKSKKTA